MILALALEVLSAKCEIACKYEGYSDGWYAKGKCACVEYFDPKDLFSTKYAPKKHDKTKVEDSFSSFL